MQPRLKVILLLQMTFLFFFSAAAQKNPIGHALEEGFRQRVKQLDEFVKRFNYEWSMEGKPLGYTPADSLQRRKYLLSLFDSDLLQKADSAKQQLFKDFILQITDTEQPLFLRFHGQEWYAEVTVSGIFRQKQYPIRLLFKTDQTADGTSRWQLASVQADFLSIAPKDSAFNLSPISHELDFGKLISAAETDPESIAAIATTDFEVDQRNIFFFLIQQKLLKIENAKVLQFHFLQAEDFIFTVRHFERSAGNVGWLISDLFSANTSEKETYRKDVLHLLK